MIRHIKKLFCLAAITAMTVTTPITAYALNYNDWLSYSSSDNSITKKWDINGDGKNEKIKMSVYGEYSDGYYSTAGVRVYSDGKKIATVSVESADSYTLDFFKLKNGKRYLYVCGVWEDEYTYHIFRCNSNGTIKKELVTGLSGTKGNVFSAVGRNRMVFKKVSGNKIIFQAEAQPSGVGYINYKVVYSYKKGKLKLSGTTYKVLGYSNWTKPSDNKTKFSDRVTIRKIKIYSNKKCTKKKKTLKKGKKIKISKIYIPSGTTYEDHTKKMSYYAKGIGWFNASDYATKGELFKGSWYAE